jgi:hypothetical protein
MEPVITPANRAHCAENSFIIFVDPIFTNLIEPLFTNVLDAAAPVAAISCLYRAGNAG